MSAFYEREPTDAELQEMIAAQREWEELDEYDRAVYRELIREQARAGDIPLR